MPLPNFRNNNVVNPSECPASLWGSEVRRADSGCGGQALIMTRFPAFIMTPRVPITRSTNINTIPLSSSSCVLSHVMARPDIAARCMQRQARLIAGPQVGGLSCRCFRVAVSPR